VRACFAAITRFARSGPESNALCLREAPVVSCTRTPRRSVGFGDVSVGFGDGRLSPVQDGPGTASPVG
jgi:hypothetical protein